MSLWAAMLIALPAAQAAYPGANGLLVFVQSEGGGTWALYTSTAAGGSARRISDAYYDAQPSWSPDGRRIVYVTESEHIWTMKADGSDKRRVTRRPASHQPRNPVYSPDGKRIMYGVFGGAQGRAVYTVRLDGSDRRRIGGNLPSGISQAVFHPAGKRIAFEYWRKGDRDPYASGIFTMRLDGTGLRQVTGPGNQDRDPSWSPDGRKIVFSRHTDNGLEVHVIRADGTGRRRIAQFRQANAKAPVWSPDGTRIVFVKEHHSGDTIWTMKPDGSGKTLAVDPGGGGSIQHAQQPDWQPS